MENTHSDFIDGHLLMAHVKYMYQAESVEDLDRLTNMAHRRIADIYELRLSEIINENAKKLWEKAESGNMVIIRKDYDYKVQKASSYFKVPVEIAEEISNMIDEHYDHGLYVEEDMEHIIEEELEIEFLAKVWEEDAGPECSYEPYEKQQEQIKQEQNQQEDVVRVRRRR